MHCVEMGMLNSVWKLFLEGCMSLLESEASLGPPITNLMSLCSALYRCSDAKRILEFRVSGQR